MYQELPHQPIERDGEIICARCGLRNPGEEDGCIAVVIESSESSSVPPKAA